MPRVAEPAQTVHLTDVLSVGLVDPGARSRPSNPPLIFGEKHTNHAKNATAAWNLPIPSTKILG